MSLNPNFIGAYFYTLDSKNRLAIPSKFRLSLQAERQLILTQGLEGCLNLYSQDSWTKLNAQLESMPLQNKIDGRAFKRMLFSSASDVSFDEEGRILIPQHLKEYGALNKEVAVIGMGNKLEIWAQTIWNQYQRKQRPQFKKYASKLEL